jgi:hypothetical protein
MNLNWETTPVNWDELVQVTDGYVVHARGFTIDEDIWLDQYALHGGHHAHWNKILMDHYDAEKWEPRVPWPEYVEDHLGKETVYWSITGSPSFIIQFPLLEDITERQEELLKATFDTLSTPDYTNVTFNSDHYTRAYTVGDIRDGELDV